MAGCALCSECHQQGRLQEGYHPVARVCVKGSIPDRDHMWLDYEEIPVYTEEKGSDVDAEADWEGSADEIVAAVAKVAAAVTNKCRVCYGTEWTQGRRRSKCRAGAVKEKGNVPMGYRVRGRLGLHSTTQTRSPRRQSTLPPLSAIERSCESRKRPGLRGIYGTAFP